MTSDTALSRELKSLHEELSTAHRQRRSTHAGHAHASRRKAAPVSHPVEAAEERQLHGELGNFVNVIKEFVAEAEKDVSAHPAATVIGAMVVGILIGRLLGRR